MERVLIVEDVESLREVLVTVLEGEGYQVDACANAESAIDHIKSKAYSCILADFRLPGKDGLELLKETRAIAPSVPYLIMTAYGSIQIAIEAMKLGANDFLTKPFEPKVLNTVVREVITHRRILDREHGLNTRRSRNFLSKDPQIEKLLYQARKVGPVDSSVLILGESGTGKELLARYIHEHSSRNNNHFIAINCAAMPSELLESEFFGHEAGAFTGATQTRVGVFEVASEGTIFLDEIGDMPLSLQVKLLRALQEREIKRLGGNKTIKVNPRIIAATNHDVEIAIADARMREDFYYRLAVITFQIPPLRERPDDINYLANHFLEYFSERLGKKLTLADEARTLFSRYPWPGNARELENVIERAAILSDGTITVDHLGVELDLDSLDDAAHSLTEIAAAVARKAEIDLIKKMLSRTSGNKSKAAQLLGVSYKTLLNKVKEYQLEQASEI